MLTGTTIFFEPHNSENKIAIKISMKLQPDNFDEKQFNFYATIDIRSIFFKGIPWYMNFVII